MPDVVVIGAGVIGSSTAWQVARRGVDVTLLEQFQPGHDRGSSHGSSRIFRLAYPDRIYVELAARALDLWHDLESVTGTSVLTLTGAVDHGPAAATEALHDALRTAGRRSELLTPQDAARRWPGLRFDTSVLFHPDAGRLHADDAVSALQSAAARAGAQIRHGVRVTGVAERGGAAEVRLADGTTLVAGTVVVAAGGWLPTVFGDVFALPQLRVSQEQPAHIDAPDALSWPSFIHHGGGELPADEGVYGTGGVDGIKIGRHAVGSLVDPDHRDRSIDPARVTELGDYARRWLPGVDPASARPSTCLYTTTPDHDFVIDRVGPFVLASACSGHGFKHAPATGEVVADLLLDGTPAPDRFALDPEVRRRHLTAAGSLVVPGPRGGDPR